jgi:hypothetical protein
VCKEFSVSCSIENAKDQFTWAFAGVYVLNFDCDRRILWDELAQLLSWWNLPWCIGGRSSAAYFRPTMVEFSDFIFDQGLMNFPLVDGTFTWSNN